ncbi:MAG TPA: aldehyde ferredoxin oxidoreductase C-terminal domain-containing protein [Chloroflexota bacterium]|nr:aldehyde ferredoxin oxidoreductase C-terminal domain-containing protein [Chloroflexota bacterium]
MTSSLLQGGSRAAVAPYGYAGAILRVDLSARRAWTQPVDEAFARKWLGGTGFGARILYDEVPANVTWDHPDNRITLATGPMAGSLSWGTSNMSVVTRGTLTNGATSTQANGFFGHCLKFSGYDGLTLQGQASDWVYLYIEDDHVELLPANDLLGMDTWQLQDTLMARHGRTGHQMSVYGIGVAGENLVKFAAIEGDYGHVASKNGVGAVLGKKKVKAIAIVRGTRPLRVADPAEVWASADRLSENIKTGPFGQGAYKIGTLGGFSGGAKTGLLPQKNYSTNVFYVERPEVLEQFTPQAIRDGFPHRGHQCSACGMKHCQMHTIPSGPHKGELADEPEYEGWAGTGATLAMTDPAAVSWLNTQCDKAGIDVNEWGWVCGWVMEGLEKGWLTTEQVGFKLDWGDAEGAGRLLWMVARREGFGDLLAEGVKRAAEMLGGEAQAAAIYTAKGASPRGHDHRFKRDELFDTCMSSSGTFEVGAPIDSTELGVPARIDNFNPVELPESMAKIYGRRYTEDSLGVCTFTNTVPLSVTADVVNAITGWDMDVAEMLTVGRRIGSLLRAFNVRCGIGPEVEFPSKRYSAPPLDGPAAGVDAMPVWEQMRDIYYDRLGWDRATGKPFDWKLRELGLEDVARELWEPAATPAG